MTIQIAYRISQSQFDERASELVNSIIQLLKINKFVLGNPVPTNYSYEQLKSFKREVEINQTNYLELLKQLDNLKEELIDNEDIISFFILLIDFALSIGNQNSERKYQILDLLQKLQLLSNSYEGQPQLQRLAKELHYYFSGSMKEYGSDFKQSLLKDIYEAISHQIEDYTKKATQVIQSNGSVQYQRPHRTPENSILVARKKVIKGMFEKGIDFLFTFGNERFEETYFFVNQRNNGTLYIEERILENEYNAGCLRFKEEFDDREIVKQQIQLIDTINQLITISTKDRNSLAIQTLTKKITSKTGGDHRAVLENMILESIGQVGKQAVSSVVLSKLIATTTLETFKVVNNALVKQGIKGFMSMGGKKMMYEGAKVVVTQAGKQITSGVVTEVGKQTVTIGTKQAIGAVASLGLSLAANAVVGAIKSGINTEWKSEIKIISELSGKDFDLGVLPNFEEKLQSMQKELQICNY